MLAVSRCAVLDAVAAVVPTTSVVSTTVVMTTVVPVGRLGGAGPRWRRCCDRREPAGSRPYAPVVSSADGAVGQGIRDVSRPYVEAGLMIVSEAPAPTTVPGDRAWTLRPTGSEGVLVTVFGTPETPGYLFVDAGPGYEFWEGAEADLPLLKRLLLATVQGRYRWWSESQTFRHPLMPWRTGQRRIVVFEWHLGNESEPVQVSQGEPFLPPDGQASAYPQPASSG